MFLAGGAASGKDFAIDTFMEGEKFKVIDVDRFKKAYLKIANLKNKYPEIQKLDLKRPADVGVLHQFVKARGTKEKVIDLLFSGIIANKLPNIIFNITFKDMNDFNELLPRLLELGYDPKSIHLTWVLTNYHEAVFNNKTRDRIVPDEVLLQTHEGAAKTMLTLLRAFSVMPPELNGDIRVVLGNRDQTKVNKSEAGGKFVKDFTYLLIKKSGKRMEYNANLRDVLNLLREWIANNIPKSNNIYSPWLYKRQVPRYLVKLDIHDNSGAFLVAAGKQDDADGLPDGKSKMEALNDNDVRFWMNSHLKLPYKTPAELLRPEFYRYYLKMRDKNRGGL